MTQRTHRLRTAARDWLARTWCGWLHGGGDIKHDPNGRINWQCRHCGRWADPVPLCEETAVTDAAIKNRTPGGCTDEG